MSEPPEPLQQRVMDALEKYDADSRPARAARLVWLSAHQVQFGAIADRAETLAVLEEARTSFISGRHIAKLILALAYVENALADVLQPPEPAPGKKTRRSPMISEAADWANDTLTVLA